MDNEQQAGGAAAVLVVNDDSAIRQMLRDILGLEGYSGVETAEDGQRALAVLRRSRASYVVLLDDLMPVMGGLEVVEAVATDPALAKQTAWVYLTARSQSIPLALTRLLTRFNARTLTYPFGVERLLRAIEEAAASLPAQ